MRKHIKKIWLLLPASLMMILTYQNCDLTRNVTPDNSKYLDITNIQSFSRSMPTSMQGPQKNYHVNVVLGPNVSMTYDFDDQRNHCSGTILFSDTHKALLENVLDYIRYIEMPASEISISELGMKSVSFAMLTDTLFVYDQAYQVGQPLRVFTQGREELLLFLKNEVYSEDTHLCPSDFDILFN